MLSQDPGHDEAERIETRSRHPGWADDVVVVDDASIDDTPEQALLAHDPRVRLVRHTANIGVGGAIATGYRAAFREGADIAVVVAGDGQMDPGDMPRLLEPVVVGAADYVTGDRLAHPEARTAMPGLRWLGNHILSWLTRVSLGVRVGDSQCGYTAISRHAAETLLAAGFWPRYGYPNDILARMCENVLRVDSVVVRPIYRDERSGIGWRHALFVIPALLLCATFRRLTTRLRPRTLPRAVPQQSVE